jgi:flagellar basal-body rod modification protein FlgD
MSSISTDNTTAGASKTFNPKSQLQVEDFINLMVTQLQQQDPTNPAKSSELLSQMSQIGQLQAQQQTQTALKDLVLQNNIGAASNMIGKDVEGIDPTTGENLTGKVKSVRVEKGNVMLRLEDDTDLPLTQIISITQPNADIAQAVDKSANATVGSGT